MSGLVCTCAHGRRDARCAVHGVLVVSDELAAEVEQAMRGISIGTAVNNAEPGEPVVIDLNETGRRMLELGWLDGTHTARPAEGESDGPDTGT